MPFKPIFLVIQRPCVLNYKRISIVTEISRSVQNFGQKKYFASVERYQIFVQLD